VPALLLLYNRSADSDPDAEDFFFLLNSENPENQLSQIPPGQRVGIKRLYPAFRE
jgi:hypothetical protein